MNSVKTSLIFQAVVTPLSSAVVTCTCAGGFGGGGARRGRVAVLELN